MNTLTAEMSAELTAAGEVAVVVVAAVVAAVEMGNTAAVAAVAADKAPSGRMLTTKQETRELAVSDLGIRSHHLSHGDHRMWLRGAAAAGMDVRTLSTTFVVGEEQRDGEDRRNGDACDSLDLVDEEAVVDLGHRTYVRGMVVSARAWGSLVAKEMGSWDPVLGGGWDLAAAHARHR